MPELVMLLLGALLVSPGFLAALFLSAGEHRRSRAADVARIDALLTLIQAAARPAEYAAYVAPRIETETGIWLSSDDGLISYRIDDEDI